MKLAVLKILFFLFYMLNLEYKNVRLGERVISVPDFTQVENAINKLNIAGTTIISDFIYISFMGNNCSLHSLLVM